MNTSTVAATPVDTIAQLIGPAVAAVERLSGVTLQAGAPTVIDAMDPTEAAASVVTRVPLSGSGTPTGIAVALPAAGHKLDPAHVASAMITAAAQELGTITGLQVAPGAPEPVTDPATVATGATIVRFEVGTGAGQLPIHWLLDASLVAALSPTQAAAAQTPGEGTTAAPASFPELNGDAGRGVARDLALLSDVPMDVTVELGKTVLQVRDLLSLREGSVVELDRSAGAAVDVLVNGTLIARGDVVVIDDDLGVRVTEIVRR